MDVQAPKSHEEQETRVHPWRICGKGKHLVREHLGHIHPSKRHPKGKTAIWHEHCALNPSHKDELSFAEIQYIGKRYFTDLSGPPTAGVLKFEHADEYDHLIRGWTQYWNDIFQLSDPLDPNVVKALIATESSFYPTPGRYKHVYGLMQLLGSTHQYLGGAQNELHDHLIRISTTELIDPSGNICGGIRWLFRKKETAAALLKRPASWDETVEDYKAILSRRLKELPYNPEPMEKFRKYYQCLQTHTPCPP
jgi:hypothetical protein